MRFNIGLAVLWRFATPHCLTIIEGAGAVFALIADTNVRDYFIAAPHLLRITVCGQPPFPAGFSHENYGTVEQSNAPYSRALYYNTDWYMCM